MLTMNDDWVTITVGTNMKDTITSITIKTVRLYDSASVIAITVRVIVLMIRFVTDIATGCNIGITPTTPIVISATIRIKRLIVIVVDVE
jgi:UDP-N-acetylmuramyl tripeptide synthase